MPNASQFVSGHDIERDRLIYVYLSDEETANMTSWKTESRKGRNDKYQKWESFTELNWYVERKQKAEKLARE